MNKYLSMDGLAHFYKQIKDLFVQKEDGKSLSSNDYTASDKSKLEGIEPNANKYEHPTGDGHNHIPEGGELGQILAWSSSGTAEWVDDDAGSTASTLYVTIPTTSWAGTPARVSVEVPGILYTDNPIVDIVLTGETEADNAIISAWSNVRRITTAQDSITVEANSAFSTNVPIQLKVVR